MKKFLVAIGLSLQTLNPAAAETLGFDSDTVGQPSTGWTCGTTGKGSQRWVVEANTSAPTLPNVLKHEDSATFAWCVRSGAAPENGVVQVKFKPVSGKEDQAGGVVWRWKNSNNYYIARANALEGNVSLYYMSNGTRRTIKYVSAPVAPDSWHTLQVTYKSSLIRVALNGRTYIETNDDHITGAGRVGVWTKAGSITLFDDFTYSGDSKR
jgi:hypothetical protein